MDEAFGGGDMYSFLEPPRRPLIDFMPAGEVTKAPSRKCASLKFLMAAFLLISLPLIG